MLASPARSGAVRARIGLESRSCVNDTIDYSYKLLEFKIMFFKFEQLELISNVFDCENSIQNNRISNSKNSIQNNSDTATVLAAAATSAAATTKAAAVAFVRINAYLSVDRYRRQPHDSDRCLLAQPARVRFEHALDLNRVVPSTTRLITARNF